MNLDIQWTEVLSNLGHIVAAYLLALPVGLERETHARSAGLRTFPLVALATCAYMMLGIQVLGDDVAHSRVITGVITGMGFIGGGAILKNEGSIRGTATAASLWAVGAIGLSVAWSRFEIALLVSVVTYVSLHLFTFAKDAADVDEDEDSAEAHAGD